MKNIITTTTFILTLCLCAIAQENNFITYQGVASDGNGEIIKDKEISIMFEITEDGDLVYAEEHQARTSSLGVFSVLIGNGDVLDGSFGNINWSTRNQEMMLYIDPEGAGNYYFLGQSSFSSVPYAQYGADEDADPENELQQLYAKVVGPNIMDIFLTQSEDSIRVVSGAALNVNYLGVPHDPVGWSNISLVNDPTFTIPVDSDPSNELQILNAVQIPDPVTGDIITELQLNAIYGGYNQSVVIDDTDPLNELQNLLIIPGLNGNFKIQLEGQNGQDVQEIELKNQRLKHRERTDVVTQNIVTELVLTNGDGVTVDSFIIKDTDFTNELQDLIFSLREGANGTYGDLALSKNPGVPSITLPDLDPTNELQDLFYDDGVLYISGGNEVELPIGESSSPWEYLNNLNIYWPNRITVGDVVSDGPGYFNNLTSMNNVFSQIFRTPNGVLELSDELIKLGTDFIVNSDGYMYVKEIAAEIKNFRMDHPEDPTKEIYYVSLEGPEAGAYERGTAKLVNGEAFVKYSDHFQLVIGDNTPTMILTPQSIDTYGLAVVEKRKDGFVVKELKGGHGNFEFDWEVKAVRSGYEDYQVVRDKK